METPGPPPAPPAPPGEEDVDPTLVRFREARKAWDEIGRESRSLVEQDIRERYSLRLPEPTPARRSLFRRLLITMLAVLASYGALTLLLGWQMAASVLSGVVGGDLLMTQVTALEDTASALLAEDRPRHELQGFLQRRYREHPSVTIALYDEGGRRLAYRAGSPGLPPPFLDPEARGAAADGKRLRNTSDFGFVVLSPVRGDGPAEGQDGPLRGFVRLAVQASTSPTRDLVLGLSWRWGFPIFLLSVLAAFLGTRSVTTRLREAEQHVRRMAAGDMSARIPVHEHDEVGRLAAAFNSTAELLERTVRDLEATDADRRSLVADFAHELNTPLTNVLAYLETLMIAEDDGSMDATTRLGFLQIAHDEARRLAHLARDLETLTKLEGGRLDMERREVDVARLAEDLASRIRPRAEAQGLAVHASVPRRAVVLGDVMRLEQVGMNLLTNALRYTDRGAVSVVVTQDAEEVCLSVVDTGVGIAAEDIPKVMSRFYRVDPSRNRRTGGSGLGLAIVGGIVRRHDGRVTIESEPGVGTAVRVHLPRAAAPAEP